MKKSFTLLVLCLTLAGTMACGGNTPKKISQNRIETLISRLQSDVAGNKTDGDERISLPGLKVVSTGGLDMVSVGKFWLSTAMKFAGQEDEDVMEAAKLMKEIKKVLIVSYEDCEENLRTNFSDKISKTLSGCDLLMEAKDDGEAMSIYGTTSRNGKTVEDIVLFAPESCALICFFGALDTDKFGEFVEKASRN